MFDRFTKGARRTMGLARQEAMRLNHNHIGTEHLLLGDCEPIALPIGGVQGQETKNRRQQSNQMSEP